MRRKLKRTFAASPVLLCGALGLGWWGLYPIHWTSQSRTEFPAAVDRYYLAVAQVAEAAPVGSFVHCGHRGGSFEEYAKNLQDGIPAAPTPVAELMDQAFDELGLTAIEIDVRPSPLDGREVVVVHDRLDEGELDPADREYVEQNTVRRVVGHFLERGYHLRGKRLAFEIKAPREGLDESAELAIDRTACTLNEVLGQRSAEGRARAAIDLISFNHAALERMYHALGSSAVGHGFYQIVTSNQYPEWLYSVSTQPPFDEGLRGKLRDVAWLRGVYFDPMFVDGFGALFNGINEDRQAHGLSLLEIHVSTYSHELEDLVERLRSQSEPLRHVCGLMYQIRKD